MPSINDVAKHAGVSIATVSNVLTGARTVSPALAKRVTDAAEALDYRANPLASGLKSKKSDTIGVIFTSFNRIFFTQVLRGIEDVALRCGYRVNLFESGESLGKEQEYVELLVNSWTDGIILSSCADIAKESDRAYLKSLGALKCRGRQIPVIGLERSLHNGISGAVLADNEQAAYDIMRHLLEMGHTRIAHIAGPPNLPMSAERMNGYRRALGEAGIPFDSNLIKPGDFTPLRGYEAMRQLLDETSLTAVFAANDQMAVGAIKAVKETGHRIPEDIAVAGFDNIFASSLIAPSLTTVNVPRYAMGVRAMELLHEKITNPESERQIARFKGTIVRRQSTDLKSDSAWELAGW